jgi:hypothetical protein
MTDAPKGGEAVRKYVHTAIGLAAMSAREAGWSESEARRIGLETGRSAQARVAEGADGEAALAAATADAQLVAALDRFSREMTRGADASTAFAQATAPIRAATANYPSGANASRVAETAFARALDEGLTPAAACASAFIAAAAASRLATAATG